MASQCVLILDFGGQYKELIAHYADIVLFLQGFLDALYSTERFSCLCHKIFLLNRRILVEQFQDCQFFSSDIATPRFMLNMQS